MHYPKHSQNIDLSDQQMETQETQLHVLKQQEFETAPGSLEKMSARSPSNLMMQQKHSMNRYGELVMKQYPKTPKPLDCFIIL